MFRADTGNNRKIVNFTFSCLYARPIKVVSVDKYNKEQSFLLFLMLKSNFLKIKFMEMLSNSKTTFNLESVNFLSNANVNPQNGVAY